MTTTASIFAMMLDQLYDARDRPSARRPINFFKERFLHMEWKKEYAWRPFLDPLIIGLGDQQLITGYAVLLSGWIKVCPSQEPPAGVIFRQSEGVTYVRRV